MSSTATPGGGFGRPNSSSRFPTSFEDALDMTPNILPFTLDEALKNTNDCRKKVDVVNCEFSSFPVRFTRLFLILSPFCRFSGEERVMRPLMDRRYKDNNTKLNDPSHYSRCLGQCNSLSLAICD